MNQKRTFYITTAIPYVNAKPHIGFALEIIQADTLARYHRQKGDEVFFVTGTDENALKNVISAEEKGVEVKNMIFENAESFKALKKTLNLSWDDFIRTTEDRHVRGAQKFWLACRGDDIYKKKYIGLYCVGCEAFKTEKELVDGKCTAHPANSLEHVEEENYFFRLSAYQIKLKEIIERDEIKIYPEARKNEVLAFIDRGLEDFSISRSSKRARGWGIRVPDDESQIIYVWFDALTNYINALGYAEDGDFFGTHWLGGGDIVHCIGKDVTRFHALYWPAMLLSAALPLPKKIFIHGYITIDGKKISKSLGNVIHPNEIISRYGTDALRYYLLREISPFEDGDFSHKKFDERYTADLANGLGNFVARTVSLGAAIGDIDVSNEDQKLSEAIQKAGQNVGLKLDEFKFHEALAEIWTLLSLGDEFINKHSPWAIKDVEEKKKVVGAILHIVKALPRLLSPFLPETAEKISGVLTVKDEKFVIKKGGVLFPRLF